jgi:putative transcription factor
MADLTCEICGNRDATVIVLIEGAKLAACSQCSRGGKILFRLDTEEGSREIVMKARSVAPIESDEVVENYAVLLKTAREKKGLLLEELAKKIGEKEGYLHAIEQGRMRPTLPTAKKLEKELKVRLIQKVSEESVPLSEIKNPAYSEPTLGDLVETKKEKKGK